MGIPVNASIDPRQVKTVTDLLKELLAQSKESGSAENPIHVVFEDSSALVRAVERVADALTKLTTPPQSEYRLIGGTFMRTFAQDRPEDVVTFTKAKVVDSEGGEVDPQPEINYTFSSDEPGISDIVDNGDGTLNVKYGTFRKNDDGTYAFATLKGESNDITLANGEVVRDLIQEQIQLVPGAAAGLLGSSLNIPEV